MTAYFDPGESISVQHRRGRLIAGRARYRVHDRFDEAYLYLGPLGLTVETGAMRRVIVSLRRLSLVVAW